MTGKDAQRDETIHVHTNGRSEQYTVDRGAWVAHTILHSTHSGKAKMVHIIHPILESQ